MVGRHFEVPRPDFKEPEKWDLGFDENIDYQTILGTMKGRKKEAYAVIKDVAYRCVLHEESDHKILYAQNDSFYPLVCFVKYIIHKEEDYIGKSYQAIQFKDTTMKHMN